MCRLDNEEKPRRKNQKCHNRLTSSLTFCVTLYHNVGYENKSKRNNLIDKV